MSYEGSRLPGVFQMLLAQPPTGFILTGLDDGKVPAALIQAGTIGAANVDQAKVVLADLLRVVAGTIMGFKGEELSGGVPEGDSSLGRGGIGRDDAMLFGAGTSGGPDGGKTVRK